MKKKTEEDIEHLQKQIEEWKSKYLRALADYQNLEKRTNEDRQEIRQYASERIVLKLLPVLDTLEKAQGHLNDKGLDLVLKEFHAVLVAQGVSKIDVKAKEFNPHEMECVEVVEGKDNVVVEEVLPGYVIHGKVLRVARVKVGRENKFEARSTKFATNEENSKDSN